MRVGRPPAFLSPAYRRPIRRGDAADAQISVAVGGGCMDSAAGDDGCDDNGEAYRSAVHRPRKSASGLLVVYSDSTP